MSVCKVHLRRGNLPDSRFNPVQLRAGVKVEHEHTFNNCIAKQIAKAHLYENKNYYTKLKNARL